MSSLNPIININITASASPLTQAAFNKVAILSFHTAWPDLLRDYSDPVAFATDFASFPGVLAMGNKFWSQDPNPGILTVIRQTVATTKTMDVTPTASNLTQYQVTMNGNGSLVATYTSDSTATVAEIVAGLKTAIDGLSIAGVSTTNNTTKLTIAASAGTWFSVKSTGVGALALKETTTNPGTLLSAQLTAAANVRNDWYFFEIEDHSAAIIEDVAAWAETQTKLFFTNSADFDVITNSSGDVASTLLASTYKRTHLDFDPDTGSYESVAMLSHMAAVSNTGVNKPGSVSFNYQPLEAVNVVNLTGDNTTNINNKRVGAFQSTAGIATTFSSVGYKGFSGQYLDVTVALDWYAARLQERIWGYLSTGQKIPYTDAGFTTLEGFMHAQNDEAVQASIFADDDNLSATINPVSQQQPADRTARIVRGAVVTARLAGAVETIYITGNVFA